jgi:DNA-binding NarL/FixJ family response regulator
MHSTEEYVTKALQIGVAGYLIKDAATSELELALRAVARGEKYLSPAISTHLIDQFKSRPAELETGLETLTPRQRETLQLIAEGHTTKEIAEILGRGSQDGRNTPGTAYGAPKHPRRRRPRSLRHPHWPHLARKVRGKQL